MRLWQTKSPTLGYVEAPSLNFLAVIHSALSPAVHKQLSNWGGRVIAFTGLVY